MLDMIERTNVFVQPHWWNKRYQRTPEFCPAIVESGTEIIYYDMRRICAVSQDEGTRLTNEPRRNTSDGHHTGWLFDANEPVWEHNPQAVFNKRKGCDDEVAIDDVNDARTGGAGLSNAGSIISLQVNGVYAQGVDEQEEDNGICDVCESAANVFRRFLTQNGFSKDELGEQWADTRGCVPALIDVASSNKPRIELYLYYDCCFYTFDFPFMLKVSLLFMY